MEKRTEGHISSVKGDEEYRMSPKSDRRFVMSVSDEVSRFRQDNVEREPQANQDNHMTSERSKQIKSSGD